MKHVKNLLLTALFALVSTGAFAQFSAAGGLSYGLEIERLGIFARGSYDLTEKIRGNATLNFFIGDSEGVDGIASVSTSLWAINLDGHYFLVEEDNLTVYGLAGLNVATVRVKFEDGTGIIGDFSDSNTEIGINIGGGVEFPLATVNPFAELKYVIGGFDQLTLMAGVRFPIGN